VYRLCHGYLGSGWSSGSELKTRFLEVAMNNFISLGQLAYCAVALSIDSNSDHLHSHFQKNFSVYKKALLKAKSFQLPIPRRAKKQK
jgi:hypothetical protein